MNIWKSCVLASSVMLFTVGCGGTEDEVESVGTQESELIGVIHWEPSSRKVQICHYEDYTDADGVDHHIIEVPLAAAFKHIIRHGDYQVSAEICDFVDNDCDGLVDEGC